ncbi:MAG: ABC transporter ATP-binding protein [Bacteroidales bacterium]
MISPPDSLGIALELNELCKDFGPLRAVDRLSLKVREGEVFGFLGPNGAGKSTAIRMMCGLLRPTSGRVLLQGRALHFGRTDGIRAHVGICPQENILWSRLTCLEQLVFSARMYDVDAPTARRRARSLLREVGLDEKTHVQASALSGGMKRRLNVILALMHDPRVLVFDEPEAGLDPQSRLLVREFIRGLARERTVILTTHNMDEADRMADRVAILDRGRLLQLDTPRNLKASVGSGDVLDMEWQGGTASDYDRVRALLGRKGFEARGEGPRCMLRGMNLVPEIPGIYKLLEGEGIGVSSLHLRENTLEDVFLHLTGKQGTS